MTHITFQTLIDYLENKLNIVEQEQVVTHLAACLLCQQELDTTRRLISARGEGLVAPPRNLLQRALVAFQRRQMRSVQRVRLDPTLFFDSWTQAAVAGVRGRTQEHQMLYSFDAYDLDLQIELDPATDLFILRGQILTDQVKQTSLEGLEVCLRLAGNETRRGLTDTLGRFSISQLPSGLGTLQITLDDADLIVEALAIQS